MECVGGGGGAQTKEYCCCLAGVLGRVDKMCRGWRGTDGSESVTEEVYH